MGKNKMTPKSASRIQSAIDKAGSKGDQAAKGRVQVAAAKNSRKKWMNWIQIETELERTVLITHLSEVSHND